MLVKNIVNCLLSCTAGEFLDIVKDLLLVIACQTLQTCRHILGCHLSFCESCPCERQLDEMQFYLLIFWVCNINIIN